MTRDELLASIVAARPGRDDLVYLERSGDSYAWHLVATDSPPASTTTPDVWISLSADWPLDDPARRQAFFEDLLAELESMADTADRCRWPVDEPWTIPSHQH
jgi:hypothetical protein